MYKPHQIAVSDRLIEALKLRGIMLLAGEPRTGKTRTSLRVAELSEAKRILVVTKKAAISGWRKEMKAIDAAKEYVVTNYEQAKHLTPTFDMCIVDESHAVGRAGKPTQRFKALKSVTFNTPVILLSGTPAVESALAYYYQFALSKHSPLPFRNFYEFFKTWGVPNPIRVQGRLVETYTKARPELLDQLDSHIITLTQEEAGIEHTAVDEVHVVHLDKSTRDLINQLMTFKVGKIADVEVGFDSDIKERMVVHQIETGAVLIEEKLIDLNNTEVVDYIKNSFPLEGLALMAHFRSTRMKLEKHFPNTSIYSSTAHSEGVDLSHYKNFVIINTDYSGAKFIQRRDRIVNLNRTTAATVHHITCEGGLSPAIYDAVSRKRDFNLEMYRRFARA